VDSLRPYGLHTIGGSEHLIITCMTDGELLVWGRCDDGQAGIPLNIISKEDIVLDSKRNSRILLKPTVVKGVKGVTAVSAGIDTSFVVDGRVRRWLGDMEIVFGRVWERRMRLGKLAVWSKMRVPRRKLFLWVLVENLAFVVG
jgi:hypothetical protein